MINDKGPEESRDTDATYIILSHQSVHLPGPSRQRGGGGERGKSRRRRKGGGGSESEGEGETREKEERERKRESYLLPVLYTQELLRSFFLGESEKKKKKKNKWQRGDKVNKKMACKITGRYSVREGEGAREGGGLWSLLISSNLTLRHAEATFPRSYLPYGLPCLDDLLGEEKSTDKFYCVSLHGQPVVSITKLRRL